MLLITYDITSNKTRAKFSKFINKYGEKVQYSVYEVKNSPRILNNITTEINHTFLKLFKETDSVLIFRICEGCKKNSLKFGYAKTQESDIIVM